MKPPKHRFKQRRREGNVKPAPTGNADLQRDGPGKAPPSSATWNRDVGGDQPSDARLPETIFKYEALALQTLQNLKAQTVFFASPLKFNDPYDCAITAGITDPTDQELDMVRRVYAARHDAPPDVRLHLTSLASDELRAMLVRIGGDIVRKEQERFLSTRGVCCFSERNDDLLMWSHYGGRYQGICLEFRTQHEPFNRLRPVRYTDQMPSIKIGPIVATGDVNQIIELYCTKSLAWSYEREWRGLHNNADTPFGYPAEALKAIYFGPRVDRLTLDIVCSILAGQNPEVELWLGRRSESEFKVEFQQTTYTPYIVAKQLGSVR